jgi:hypothetical protein
MKVLDILNDGPTQLSDEIISLQAKDQDVKITDPSKRDASYESIVDDIFARDRVSW